MARKYPYGLNQVGRLKVYTNRGLGTILLPARFGCPPEITLLTVPNENSVQPMADVIPTRTANLSSSSRDLLESLVTKFADARVFK